MSTAVAWEDRAAVRGRRVAPGNSAPLRLVTRPGDVRAGSRAWPPPSVRSAPVGVRRAAPPASSGMPLASLHLTRLGRLACTLLAVALLVGMSSLALASRAGGGGGDTAAAQVVLVQRGQTLSELARTHVPQRSVPDAIALIQLANGLSSDHVLAGQRLLIPTG